MKKWIIASSMVGGIIVLAAAGGLRYRNHQRRLSAKAPTAPKEKVSIRA